MNAYDAVFSERFNKEYITQKNNFQLRKRVDKKIHKILENPHHYKPLRNIFKNQRRAHIGSFVLTFEIQEANKKVIFHRLQHHDTVYKK